VLVAQPVRSSESHSLPGYLRLKKVSLCAQFFWQNYSSRQDLTRGKKHNLFSFQKEQNASIFAMDITPLITEEYRAGSRLSKNAHLLFARSMYAGDQLRKINLRQKTNA
jgi:hypothetical protein